MCVCVCVSDQDGAEPSANSVSASNLLRLSHYTGRQEWLQKSQRLLAAFSDRLTKVPIALPEMVRALMAQHYTLKQVSHLLPLHFSSMLKHIEDFSLSKRDTCFLWLALKARLAFGVGVFTWLLALAGYHDCLLKASVSACLTKLCKHYGH